MTAEWEDQVGMPPNDGNDVEKIGPSVPHSLHKTTHITFSPKPSLTISMPYFGIYIYTHIMYYVNEKSKLLISLS